MEDEEIKKFVREGYAKIVTEKSSCCTPVSNCCGGAPQVDVSKMVGYSDNDLGSIPDDANLGLGCGNPVALASLKEGEVVLDLGSGAGIDCFLAANKVGKSGKVIGVDMTPEMLAKSREIAHHENYENVEFRLGEIENLPVGDDSVDVIISNCVINLSVDKERVFKEAYRVTKPGGRLMVSDIVLLKEIPQVIMDSLDAYVGCISGAMLKDDYMGAIEEAGFGDVKIIEESVFPIELISNDPTAQAIIKTTDLPIDELKDIASSVVSVKVVGTKER